MPLTIQIITPEKALAPAQADHVTATAADGEVGIRSGHAPLVAALRPGHVMVRSAGKESWWAIAGGVMQVLQDEVKLFVERTAEGASIDSVAVQARLAKLEGESPAEPAARRTRDAEIAWLRAQLLVFQRSAPKTAL
jgi:F-type H+-transporting ATPase subunit epsilon